MCRLNKKYHTKIAHATTLICCPKCSIYIPPKLMVRHLRFSHQIETQFRCPWCLNFSWRKGEHGHTEHRLSCLLTTLENNRKSIKYDRRLMINHVHKSNFTTSIPTAAAIPTPEHAGALPPPHAKDQHYEMRFEPLIFYQTMQQLQHKLQLQHHLQQQLIASFISQTTETDNQQPPTTVTSADDAKPICIESESHIHQQGYVSQGVNSNHHQNLMYTNRQNHNYADTTEDGRAATDRIGGGGGGIGIGAISGKYYTHRHMYQCQSNHKYLGMAGTASTAYGVGGTPTSAHENTPRKLTAISANHHRHLEQWPQSCPTRKTYATQRNTLLQQLQVIKKQNDEIFNLTANILQRAHYPPCRCSGNTPQVPSAKQSTTPTTPTTPNTHNTHSIHIPSITNISSMFTANISNTASISNVTNLSAYT